MKTTRPSAMAPQTMRLSPHMFVPPSASTSFSTISRPYQLPSCQPNLVPVRGRLAASSQLADCHMLVGRRPTNQYWQLAGWCNCIAEDIIENWNAQLADCHMLAGRRIPTNIDSSGWLVGVSQYDGNIKWKNISNAINFKCFVETIFPRQIHHQLCKFKIESNLLSFITYCKAI